MNIPWIILVLAPFWAMSLVFLAALVSLSRVSYMQTIWADNERIVNSLALGIAALTDAVLLSLRFLV